MVITSPPRRRCHRGGCSCCCCCCCCCCSCVVPCMPIPFRISKKGIEIIFFHRSFDGWNLNPGTFSAPSAFTRTFGHVSKVCWWRQDPMPQHLLFGLEGPSGPWFLSATAIDFVTPLSHSWPCWLFASSISWWHFPPGLLPPLTFACFTCFVGRWSWSWKACTKTWLVTSKHLLSHQPSSLDESFWWMRVSHHGL